MHIEMKTADKWRDFARCTHCGKCAKSEWNTHLLKENKLTILSEPITSIFHARNAITENVSEIISDGKFMNLNGGWSPDGVYFFYIKSI